MSDFTWLLGEPALSEFRKTRLSLQLVERFGLECSIDSRFVYFIESDTPLEAADTQRLGDLLHAKSNAALDRDGLILVVPRLGTLSPWSSKATDISSRCGLSRVKRIERGTAYWVGGTSSLSTADSLGLHALLHDRMTQSVLDDIDACARGVEVRVDGVRQDVPPKMESITYELIVDTDETDHRLELLHDNVKKFGTVFNTVAPGTQLTGILRRKLADL